MGNASQGPFSPRGIAQGSESETNDGGAVHRAGRPTRIRREFRDELHELEVEIPLNQASKWGVVVGRSEDGEEQTRIDYDRTAQTLCLDTTRSGRAFGRETIEQVPLAVAPDEPLKLGVFVDRSTVGVFANDRQAMARRIVPTLGGRAVAVFIEGIDMAIRSIRDGELMPTHPF